MPHQEARPRRRARRALAAVGVLTGLAVAAAACVPATAGTGSARRGGQDRVIRVVASENFWGSIAGQLGGSHVAVYSIISDPNADPHSFESSASSARAVAEADYVIMNGAGYDTWISQLMSASPNPHRKVLSIAALLGKSAGDNPHFWYSPRYVSAAENRIEADFKALDPHDAAYFTARRAATDAAFAGLRSQLARIRRDYAGQPVASTESIVVYLARYLRLRLISPPEFMTAVSEGSEPTAASVAGFSRQLAARQPRVLLYNEQTATALTTSMRELASRNHIPVVGVTETIQPPQLSYERWLSRELAGLAAALRESLRSEGRS